MRVTVDGLLAWLVALDHRERDGVGPGSLAAQLFINNLTNI